LLEEDYDKIKALIDSTETQVRMKIEQDGTLIWIGWAQINSDIINFKDKTIKIAKFETLDEYSRSYAAWTNSVNIFELESPGVLHQYNDNISGWVDVGNYTSLEGVLFHYFNYAKLIYGFDNSSQGANKSLDFADILSYDFGKMFLSDTSYIMDSLKSPKISANLKVFSEWLQNLFQVHWYIEYDFGPANYKIKIKHIADVYSTTGTLDLTDETEQLNKGEYIYKENPNRESWNFETAGEFAINGLNNEIIYNVFSEFIQEYDLAKIERSIERLVADNVEGGRLSWVYSTLDGALRKIDDQVVGAVPILSNGDMYQHNLLDIFFQDFRFFDKAIINGVQETGLGLRPKIQFPEINFVYTDLLNAFDMDRAAVTTMGNAYFMEFAFNLKEKKASVIVHK